MIRVVLILSLLAPAAFAQLRLYVAPPNSEIPISGVYEQGTVAAGDTLETRFRVRNHGISAVTITSLGVAGSGFSIANQPSLPHTLAPGLNADFVVRFHARDYGTYSANLSVNGISVLLRAASLAAVMVRSNGNPISAGASIDFGRAERGSASVVSFELANATTQMVGFRSIQVTGAAFRGDVLPAPGDLAPGTAAPFVVRFEPKTAGVFTGTLVVDGREFRLTGAAMEPAFTRPTVVLEEVSGESGRQGRVSVRFGSPSRASGTGRLRIEFQPLETADNDSGILFPGSGSRTIPFTVKEGEAEARFGDVTQAVFQTGTTAGNIVLTAEVGGFTEQTNVVIGSAAVRFDQSAAARNGNSLEVKLTGFDNTHSVGEIAFTFYDRSGQPVQPGAIRVNARDDFKRYFEASTLGGVFALRATFPVAGNAADIQGVEVEFANSHSTTRTPRLKF
jgi:hypothetical protein